MKISSHLQNVDYENMYIAYVIYWVAAVLITQKFT